MNYALIISRIEQLDQFKVLNNMSIFEILLFELIKDENDLYIVTNEKFEIEVYTLLNKHNYLINKNVHLIIYQTKLDNYFITFILANLITDNIKLIPLDDFNFDKNNYPMTKSNIKIIKKIIWNHPIYNIKSSQFKSHYLVKKKYKFCPIEFFIDHKKTEFKYFFNKVHQWTPDIMPTMETIEKIKEFNYFKLSLYKFK